MKLSAFNASNSLTAIGRVDIHRQLGIAGFILACSMLIAGIWAATDQLWRGSHARDPLGFYIIPLANIVVFAVLILVAYRARFDSAAHKRLIIVASTALMTAPIARWHLYWSHHTKVFGFAPPAAERLSYIFILLLIIYDLCTMRRVHRTTVWAGAFLIMVQQFALHFGRTSVWCTRSPGGCNLSLEPEENGVLMVRANSKFGRHFGSASLQLRRCDTIRVHEIEDGIKASWAGIPGG